MLKHRVRLALVVTLALVLITGLVYPGLGQLLFPHHADGLLVTVDGRVIGRLLIGQTFPGARYFHAQRPAAAGGYDDTVSGGANLGPTSANLADTLIVQVVDSAVQPNHWVKGQIPADLVRSTALGLDPDISPASAAGQVARVARARGLAEAAVRVLVARHTDRRILGVLGEPRVHVLWLNLGLDSLGGRR